MAEGIRWRKAVAISLLLHGVVLTIIGWLAAKTFAAHEVPERYVELELIGELSGGGGRAGIFTRDTDVVNQVPAASAVASKSEDPVTVTEQTLAAQTYADNMSVLATEPAAETTTTAAFALQAGGIGHGTGVRVGSGPGFGPGTAPGSGTGNGGKVGGISPPGILSRVEPTYPEQARQGGREGTVVLKIQILENGRPGHVSVYRSSGSDLLDNAAVDAVRQWRFIPAKERESGQAIVCYTTMPVVFRLKS